MPAPPEDLEYGKVFPRYIVVGGTGTPTDPYLAYAHWSVINLNAGSSSRGIQMPIVAAMPFRAHAVVQLRSLLASIIPGANAVSLTPSFPDLYEGSLYLDTWSAAATVRSGHEWTTPVTFKMQQDEYGGVISSMDTNGAIVMRWSNALGTEDLYGQVLWAVWFVDRETTIDAPTVPTPVSLAGVKRPVAWKV